MEISIRTMDEINDQRISLTVTCRDHGEAVKVCDRLLAREVYTAEQVGDFQASEAELVSAPLRAEIKTLTDQRDAAVLRADQNQKWGERAEDVINGLTAQRDEAWSRIEGLKATIDRVVATSDTNDKTWGALVQDNNKRITDLVIQRDEARAQAKALSDEAATINHQIADLEDGLRTKATQIDNIRYIVNGPARNAGVKIQEIRDIVFPDDPDHDSDEPTHKRTCPAGSTGEPGDCLCLAV